MTKKLKKPNYTKRYFDRVLKNKPHKPTTFEKNLIIARKEQVWISYNKYNQMCKDLNKTTFTEEEIKEWRAKQPKKSKPPKYKCPHCNSELKKSIYKESCDLCGFDINKKEEKMEQEKRSRTIPKHVQREVWRRDRGRCVECETKELLEFDHIIPFSKGGSNTARNIQLLCEKCNRTKYNKIGDVKE